MGATTAAAADAKGRQWQALLPGAARALGGGIAIGLTVFLLFVALAYASIGTGGDRLAAQVREGFADEQIRPTESWSFGNTEVGTHQFNDCLILFQTLDDRASRWERAVSPLSVPIDTDSCERLYQLTASGTADAPPRFYHQYLHAHTTLARLLVPQLGVRGTRELYRLGLSLLLLAGIGYAMLELVRRRRSDLNALWLVFFLAFARLFGLEAFGQSLGHAPADMLLLAFLLFLSRGSAEAPLPPRTAILGAGLFGALTLQFEFLTGGIPLGLAMIVGALPLALEPDHRLARTVAGAALAFVGAALATAVAKLALVLAVFGTAPLVTVARQLLFRTGISHAPNRDEPVGFGTFVEHVWAGLSALAPGLHWLVFGLILFAGVGGGWAYRQLRASPDFADRARALALLGSNLVLLLWMVLFWQHTGQHAWFMDRILVWPVATGFALFVLALVRQSAALSSSREAG